MSATSYYIGRNLMDRYQITSTTLWRWQQDPKLEFPAPVKLNGRNMWASEDVHAWERKRATRRGAA